MHKGRLEAFSDGVIAILITIMVLELHVPAGGGLDALRPLVPKLLCYALSFVFLAIYWNNHHHMLQAVRVIDGRALWANTSLLFWLSLTPFATAWMGEHFGPVSVAAYGVVLFLSGVAYYVLARILVGLHGAASPLGRAIGMDQKGRLSLVIYALAVALAAWRPLVSCGLYVVVAIMWLVPDRRIERALHEHAQHPH